MFLCLADKEDQRTWWAPFDLLLHLSHDIFIPRGQHSHLFMIMHFQSL